MAITTYSGQTALLKQVYNSNKFANFAERTSPLLKLVKKDQLAQGLNLYPIPVVTSGNFASASFAIAQQYAAAASSVQFNLTTTNVYSVAQLDRQLMMRSKNMDAAFVKQFDLAMQSAMYGCTRKLSQGLYGTSAGSIGAFSIGGTSGTGATLTMTSIPDVIKFTINMPVVATSAAGAARTTPAQATVTAINYTLGTVTLSGNFTGTDWVNTDLVYTSGDVNSMISGLQDWIFAGTVTSTPFYGVNRTVAPDMLAGSYRAFAAGTPIDERIYSLQSTTASFGGRPDLVILNPVQYRRLITLLQGRNYRMQQDSTLAKVGLLGVDVDGDMGSLKVVSDQFCPVNLFYVLQLDTWVLASVGPYLGVFEEYLVNGAMQMPGADAYEIRMGGYVTFGTRAPGYNAVGTLDPATGPI